MATSGLSMSHTFKELNLKPGIDFRLDFRPRERERGVTEGGTAGDPACSDQQLCEPWGRLPLEIPVAGGRERACGRARPAVAASDRTAEEAAGGRH
ncbi:hypothetical protein NDU88_010808 [Pleurodeles waltl]|uniref:Uncharacterized protein n=1 Tax=Pleurodeles waltl TaxID=8319 RepID=A0AAV7QWY4_PLEWA|nr:hypothetical protein NDU88_010808 [Pleurodeles waltl]